jgi:hypothetical protein
VIILGYKFTLFETRRHARRGELVLSMAAVMAAYQLIGSAFDDVVAQDHGGSLSIQVREYCLSLQWRSP